MHESGGTILLDINLILKKALISENMKVADLGCGLHGHVVFPVAKLVGKKGIVYAVDILKTVLDNIKRVAEQDNIEQVKTIWTNLEVFQGAKIESSSLDTALLINTLYQSPKRLEILREATRLLKKDGKFAIVDWKKINTPFGPPLEDKVNIENIKEVLKKLGFLLQEEFDAGHYHFGLIFVKL